jgi:hypothetical protein
VTWLADILISRGVSRRLAPVLAWTAAAVVAIAVVLAVRSAFAGWLDDERTEAVTSHDKDVTIEAANRVIVAERAATANQTANASVFANAQEELHDEARDKGTTAPVGPGVQSVLDRMRAQQAAGRR